MSDDDKVKALLNGPSSGIALVEECKAHLPSEDMKWYVIDVLLRKLIAAYEKTLNKEDI